MSLKVIGAGFGRTGTMSLKLALEQLGFGPCYHMMEVFNHPEHSDIWLAAAQGGKTDWNALFKGYDSAVDWPVCHFWRELSGLYPDAKIILTERDPESWFRSFSGTILEAASMVTDLDQLPPERRSHARMVRYLIGEKTFGFNRDKAHILDVYRAHNEAVKREIPKARLLVYDSPQGWKPLCDFLGVAVPDAPYPRTNTTEEFRARAGVRNAASTSGN